MAIGKSSDFQLHDDYFHTGYTEVLAQAAPMLEEQSRGAIRIVDRDHIGDRRQETFFKSIVSASLVKRMDKAAAIADRTDEALEQARLVSPKLLRTIQVAQSRQAFVDIGADPMLFSMVLGQQYAKALMLDQINTAALCLVTALNKAAATKADRTSQSTGTTVMADLIEGKQLMGDRAMSMRSWLGHSNVHFHLLKEQVNGSSTPNIFSVGDMAIAAGMPASLGLPLVQTDSDELKKVISSTNTWYLLGLMEDAVIIENSQDPFVYLDIVTGKTQIFYRIQGEFGYTPVIKGWAFSSADADANPDDSTLGTASKWTQQVRDVKDGPGALVITDASTS